jgi:hypothetical protein
MVVMVMELTLATTIFLPLLKLFFLLYTQRDNTKTHDKGIETPFALLLLRRNQPP